MRSIVRPGFRHWLKRHVPLLVGLLSVAITLLVTLQLDIATRQRDEARFDAWIQKTHDSAQDRIYNHTSQLRGLLGLFTASEHVTADEFDRFITSFDLAEHYPALRGLGFAVATQPSRRERVAAVIHDQDPAADIWPESAHATIYPTVYFCALDPAYENMLGFDIGTDPVGLDAMVRSRRTLDAAASGDGLVLPVAATALVPRDVRHFALYLPVFGDDRQAGRPRPPENEVPGYLYAIIDTEGFWQSIFHPLSLGYFDVWVHNGRGPTDSTLRFANGNLASEAAGSHDPMFRKSVSVDIAGRPWTLQFHSRPAFEATSSRPVVVPLMFGGGMVVSLSLFLLTRSQTRAWMTANDANDDLQRSEQRLREMNETLEQRVAARSAVAERRAAQVRRLADEVVQIEQRERRRLAHTLHDHLQQLLIAARFRLELFGPTAPAEEAQVVRQELDSLLREAIDASRSLTIELSPPILHQSGLVDCLNWLARHVRQQHRLEVTVQVEGEPADLDALVAENAKVMLFEAVREALLNVVKYAGVPEAVVRVGYHETDNLLELAVVDQGAGFEADKVVIRGAGVERFGLFSIRERLELLDGEVTIVSAPGQGTCITLRLPAHHPAPSPT